MFQVVDRSPPRRESARADAEAVEKDSAANKEEKQESQRREHRLKEQLDGARGDAAAASEAAAAAAKELERAICRMKEAEEERKALEGRLGEMSEALGEAEEERKALGVRVGELSEALGGAEEAFREADKLAFELRAELGAAGHSSSAQEVRLKELEAELREARGGNVKLSENLNAKMQEQMIWRMECVAKLAEQEKQGLAAAQERQALLQVKSSVHSGWKSTDNGY